VHDRHEVTVCAEDGVVAVELEDVQPDSRLCGLRKRVLLDADSAALLIGYDLPMDVDGLTVETCLSPDYYQLLREGAGALLRHEGRTWRGASTGSVAAWVALAGDEDTSWCAPAESESEPGHGLLLRLRAYTRCFHLLLGVGLVDDDTAGRAVLAGRERLARLTPATVVGAPR
jgi:starch synthase